MTRKKAIEKVDAGVAKFEEWFAAQYGERPAKAHYSLAEMVSSMQACEYELGVWRERVKELADWENCRDAALKAWQARERQR